MCLKGGGTEWAVVAVFDSGVKEAVEPDVAKEAEDALLDAEGGGGGGAFLLREPTDEAVSERARPVGEAAVGTSNLYWYFLGIGGSSPTSGPPFLAM